AAKPNTQTRIPFMTTRFTRRRFLQTAAATTLARPFLRADQPPASERLDVGIIALTNRGGATRNGVADAGVNIVALCDVDERRAGPVREKYPKAVFEVDRSGEHTSELQSLHN